MDAQLVELVEKARTGDAEALARLVEALRSCVESARAVLVEASGSLDVVLRCAAARVAVGRPSAWAGELVGWPQRRLP